MLRFLWLRRGGVVKKIVVLVVALAITYVAVSGALFAAMRQQPETFARVMSHVPWPALAVLPFKPLWYWARAGHFAIGDAAPDFSLESPDHQDRVQLSSLKGHKPVVLVFGSYT
jgi:AhpC/TSA family